MPNPSELQRLSLEPMYPLFNMVVLHMAHYIIPLGWQSTSDATQVDTLEKITDYYNRTGMIKVWSGGSDDTIFGDPDVNIAFRAWHDWCHVVLKLPFTENGEFAAMVVQFDQFKRELGWTLDQKDVLLVHRLLFCEIMEQFWHKHRHGEFPADQREFTRNYMERHL